MPASGIGRRPRTHDVGGCSRLGQHRGNLVAHRGILGGEIGGRGHVGDSCLVELLLESLQVIGDLPEVAFDFAPFESPDRQVKRPGAHLARGEFLHI